MSILPHSLRTPAARELWSLFGVGFVVSSISLTIFRQGLNFLDDGVWLLGAQSLAEDRVLYRDFFTIYGPARFVALAGVFEIFGPSARSLALLQALVLGAFATGGIWAARRLGAGAWSGLILLGVLALGPLKLKLVAAGLMALLWGWRLRRPLDRQSAAWLGLGWGVVATFGLDAFLQALVLSVGTTLLLAVRPPARRLLDAAAVFALSLSVPFLWAVATGALDDFVWDAIVYPLTRFRSEMGISLLSTLGDLVELGTPFARLKTGETLSAFLPAHESWRALSIWLLAAAILVTPWLVLARARGRLRDPLLAAMVMFAFSSWLPLLGRGDVSHLLAAGLASLWLWPVLVAFLRRPVLRVGVTVALLLLVLGPSLAENLWLAVNAGRDGLREWERPRARVLLAGSRIHELEATVGSLPGRPSDPAVFWPAQPGLHFVFDIPPAVGQVTLLGGEVRDPEALVAELRRTRPPRVVLAARWRLRGRTTRELCPEAWTFFRRHYRVAQKVADTEDPFFVLEPVSGGRAAMLELSLSQRLFDRRQSVANGLSPDLRAGQRVGQVLTVGELDLSGLRVRWAAGRAPIKAPVQIVLWNWEGGALGEPFQGYRSQVSFDAREKVSEFVFDPPPPTAGRRIVITLELLESDGPPVQLFWHEPESAKADLFDEGTALVDGRPVDADLYFTTY